MHVRGVLYISIAASLTHSPVSSNHMPPPGDEFATVSIRLDIATRTKSHTSHCSPSRSDQRTWWLCVASRPGQPTVHRRHMRSNSSKPSRRQICEIISDTCPPEGSEEPSVHWPHALEQDCRVIFHGDGDNLTRRASHVGVRCYATTRSNKVICIARIRRYFSPTTIIHGLAYDPFRCVRGAYDSFSPHTPQSLSDPTTSWQTQSLSASLAKTLANPG